MTDSNRGPLRCQRRFCDKKTIKFIVIKAILVCYWYANLKQIMIFPVVLLLNLKSLFFYLAFSDLFINNFKTFQKSI